jgi:hypothetical protein
MIRTAFLTATSVIALGVTTTAASACTISATTATCGPGANAPLSSNVNNLTVNVETGAEIVTPNEPLTLGGDDQTVNNDGLLRSTARDGIRSTGDRLTVNNDGTIEAAGRGIRFRTGATGGSVVNEATGTIKAGDRAIASDNDTFGGEGSSVENVTVTNYGTIESTSQRALQLRGTGTTVFNYGAMTSAVEVIEGRLNFTLENHATGSIVIKDGVTDEDGVQYASGTVKNWGLIQGSDDGIDVDEGTITNYAGGQIISKPSATDVARAGNAIDADDVLQDPAIAPASQAQAGLLRIVNAGLIKGPRAISADANRQGRIEVENTGVLQGVDGTTIPTLNSAAVDFALGMAGSFVKLSGESKVIGSVRMTNADDVVEIGTLTSGVLMENITDGILAVFDGREGIDHVDLSAYGLTDIVSLGLDGNSAFLSLLTAGGLVQGSFLNFEFWKVGDTTYSTAELADLRPVPLPAGLPLLGAGLAGLWVLRRRRTV